MDEKNPQPAPRPQKSETARHLNARLSQERDIERMFSETLAACARRVGPAAFFTGEHRSLRGWRVLANGNPRDISEYEIPPQDGVLRRRIAELQPFAVSPDADSAAIAEMRVLRDKHPLENWPHWLFGERPCAEIVFLPWSLGGTLGGVFVFVAASAVDGALMIEMAEAVGVLADNVVRLYAAEHARAPESPDLAAGAENSLENIAGRIRPSALFKKLLENEHNDAIGIADLHRLIIVDPEICTRVVNLADGPYFGSGISVETIEEAFVLLERRVLNTALLVSQAREMYLERGRTSDDDTVARIWRHALACGAISRALAGRSAVEHADYAFAAGMLHDIGRLILYRARPEAFAQWFAGASVMVGSVIAAETDIFGYTHIEIGERWARDNEMPEPIINAIAEHHSSELRQSGAALSAIVEVANVLCRYYGIGLICRSDIHPDQNVAWHRLGLPDDTLFELEQELPMILAAEPLCF